MSRDTDNLIQKYNVLSASIKSSLESYKTYYSSILDIFFNDDGKAKTVEIEVEGKVIDIPLACVADFPEPPRIEQIKIVRKEDL